MSVCTPLVFEMQLINGALFLNATILFRFALFGSVKVIVPLTTIYASEKPHRSHLNIGVLILISLLTVINFNSFFSNKSW